MVLFVKAWSKKRNINTPYHGTLSSYGYVLMVLHYLVNVVKPFVLPNLQTVQAAWTDELSTKEVDLDGYNIRFFRNEAFIRDLASQKQINVNGESLGSLLRGFFQYYAHGSPNVSFHWMQDVLSLRTPGGILAKKSKGWVEAKTETVQLQHSGPGPQSKDVRQRYLLAIEDPFETHHNIGRTVVHKGVVAIRDEFRRACRIIEGAGIVGDRVDLFEEVDQKKNENLQYRYFGPRPRGGYGHKGARGGRVEATVAGKPKGKDVQQQGGGGDGVVGSKNTAVPRNVIADC